MHEIMSLIWPAAEIVIFADPPPFLNFVILADPYYICCDSIKNTAMLL